MLVIDTENCASCRLCEKACPTGAIRVIGRKPEIDNSLCNGCKRCMYVCPNNAINEITETRGKAGLPGKEELQELSKILDDLKYKLARVEKKLK